MSARVVTAQLAVVGASAAGLAATLAAARAGIDVVLLESRTRIGEPAPPAIVGFDFLWPEPIARPADAVRRRLAGARLRASDGRGPRVDAPLSLFDRARFDQRLADEAEKSGARVFTGLADVRARDDRSLVADGIEVRADVLLFADGARTQAVRFLRPTRDPAGLSWGAILDVEAEGDADELLLTFGPHAAGGRSQLNPLGGGRWAHWTFFRGETAAKRGADAPGGGLGPKDAEKVARRALALDARLQGWSEPKARFVAVAPDPVYLLPRELARGNVMVAGGAAGQGGLEVGLASGWIAGEAAARALRGEGKLSDYDRAWKARYQKGYQRLRRAADALAHLSDAETRALFGAWDGCALRPDHRARDLWRHPRGALAVAWAAWLANARS